MIAWPCLRFRKQRSKNRMQESAGLCHHSISLVITRDELSLLGARSLWGKVSKYQRHQRNHPHAAHTSKAKDQSGRLLALAVVHRTTTSIQTQDALGTTMPLPWVPMRGGSAALPLPPAEEMRRHPDF